MLQDILDWIYILGAIGAFLLFIWKLATGIERKKNAIDESDRTLDSRLTELETKVTTLEEERTQEATKRIEKSEDNGKLLQELLEKLSELK